MFIAVYEFQIKPNTETEFRQAWLDLTKAIYQHCGSFGSRLHLSDKPNVLVGYAQWLNKEQWERDFELTDALSHAAHNKMRDCLLRSETVYKLEVCDDYLQSTPASE